MRPASCSPRAERGQRNPLVEFYLPPTAANSPWRSSTRRANGRRSAAPSAGRSGWTIRCSPRRWRGSKTRDLLTTLLGEIFAAETWATWDERLSPTGVTYGLVGRITDHAGDPQLEANRLLPEFVDGFGLKTLDSPFQIVGETKTQPKMAPGIGQHTAQILEEFGAPAAQAAADRTAAQ